jgi:hypothetical protein
MTNDGKGCHKSWLQQLESVTSSRVTRTISYEYSSDLRLVTNQYSGRAAVFREELQANRSCDTGRQATSEDTV